MVIENVFGQSFEKPARHMREYLSILIPCLEGEQVNFTGETLSASTFGPLQIDAPPPPVLVAALGTTMLRIAGRMASGTVTWMTGPATLESHIIPTIRRAAAEAGRPEPRIGVGLPVCVTGDVAAARAKAAEVFVHLRPPALLPGHARPRRGERARPTWPSSAPSPRSRPRSAAWPPSGRTDFCGAPFGTAGEIRRTVEALAALVGT